MNSIYHIFSQVNRLGFFEKILQSLLENSKKNFLVEIDSTFCKLHQHAAGVRKILGNQNIGVSRGGKTTKIHSLVNQHFLAGEKVLADKAFYSSICSDDSKLDFTNTP